MRKREPQILCANNRLMSTMRETTQEELQTEPKNLLDAIERVVELVRDSRLSDDFYHIAAMPISYLVSRLNMTREQVVLFSVFIDLSSDKHILANDIRSFIDCSQIELLRRMNDIRAICSRKLVCSRIRDDEQSFFVPDKVLTALQNDEVYKCADYRNLTLDQFFEALYQLVVERRSNTLTYDTFCDSVEELMNANEQLPFVVQLRLLNLSQDDTILFLWCCNMLVNDSDPHISRVDLEDLYSSKQELRHHMRSLEKETSDLIKKQLLCQICEQGLMGLSSMFELTEKVRNEMLAELGFAITTAALSRDLTSYETITAKQLFYNPKESQQLSQLATLLQPTRFNEICDRLSEQGMRRGFACLFYGGPGTGKTETVLQLARQTGRNLFQVNLSELRDKYVGESEKRVKAIFDNYRKIVKKSDIAPILFFNEADAIINKRNENATDSVDKMENALQNIILQELENLEGILIATTNLTKNLDSAFERRFIYKIEFQKPALKAKSAIWLSMIPELTDADAMQLAKEFDFSGGQIENIARKQIIEKILFGEDISLNRLREICDAELLDKRPIRSAIGF